MSDNAAVAKYALIGATLAFMPLGIAACIAEYADRQSTIAAIEAGYVEVDGDWMPRDLAEEVLEISDR